jgi:DNA repair protein RAD5
MNDRYGNPILELLPRTETDLHIGFSEHERDFYNALFQRSKVQFEGFVQSGVVMNKYMQVLTLLLRLRQCCDHPFLTLGKQCSSDDEFAETIDSFIAKFANRAYSSQSQIQLAPEFLSSIRQDLSKTGDDREECRICLEPPDDAVIATCGHWYCAECVYPIFNSKGVALCPICRNTMRRDELKIVPRNKPRFNIDFVKDWKHSSKTARLVEELETLRTEQPFTKSLVFSQWTAMLDLVCS